MTAIEKLRSAFAAQLARNVELHGEYVMIGQNPDDATVLHAIPEYEHGQEPDEEGEEPDWLTLFDIRAALDEIAELEKREPLPFKQVITDPGEAYMAMLLEWEDDKRKLSYYKEQEGTKRRMLFAGAFPNPVENTNKLKLSNGGTVKGQYKIGRKIDEAALPVTLQAMREAGVANTDALIKYTPSLAKREWNTLSDENKLLFSPAIIATPGMPGFDYEPPKGGL